MSHIPSTYRAVIRTIVVGALSQFWLLDSFQAHAADVSFDNFPFMVRCEVNGVYRAFYISKIDPDGVATYITPDHLAGTVTINGKAQPIGGNGPGNCTGKTLQELRSSGQTYYLQH